MKENYERTLMEVIRFYTDDVITTTGGDPYEGWNPNDPGNGSGGDPYEGSMTSP